MVRTWLAALALCGCIGDTPEPPPAGCPQDRIYVYCSDRGQACSADGDCCGSLWCDPATGGCTDGLTGLPSGSRCSPESPCLTDVDPAAGEEILPGVLAPVHCDRGICRWLDPRGEVGYCSDLAAACDHDGDCCGATWCDPTAGLCTDGVSQVGRGTRCSDETTCRPTELVAGEDRLLYCDTAGLCEWAPYCAP